MYLDQAVIKLHEVAQLVEQQIGKGQLSYDIRQCADRLAELITPISLEAKDHDPTI